MGEVMTRETYKRLADAVLKQCERENELTKNLKRYFIGNFVSDISTGLQSAGLRSPAKTQKEKENEKVYS
jgi:hypothetical protein